ncbi:MAG: aminoglycoside phosphotransferase family protein [Oscillospiraceae bacterium]|nr:aminoglycoside phosphotransferase family protein [Oscillospiraceae bacterium]
MFAVKELLAPILAHFALADEVVSCEKFGHGHINKTYLVVTKPGERFILQQVNNTVFKDMDGLMNNIAAVTEYLLERVDDPREVMQLVKTVDGKPYLYYEQREFWRMTRYVEDSICLQLPETPADFYESAVAFGRFQQRLKDFPAHTLTETIPHFHDTPDRYRAFHRSVEADKLGRAASVQEEIEFALAREEEAGILVNLLAEGKLPLRVTHNDTKMNNVMLDAATRKALCVIDLDTVMPGLSVYDYGDSIRFGASTAAEDETDLSKVEMSLDLFRTYTEGFLTACPGLTELERKMLPMGAKLMTLECGVRFLADYLDGDVYFSTHYEGQNLDRCRTQFKLVADMEAKWQQMNDIVKELSK